jgi:hypothetical protein
MFEVAPLNKTGNARTAACLVDRRVESSEMKHVVAQELPCGAAVGTGEGARTLNDAKELNHWSVWRVQVELGDASGGEKRLG